MSWMSEISILVQEAQAEGIELEVDDFEVIDGRLTLDGMPAEQWIDAMTEGNETDDDSSEG